MNGHRNRIGAGRGHPRTGAVLPRQKRFGPRLIWAWLMLLAALVAPGHPATAQTADTQADQIGEIVVTAQKRPERLQDVPISVQAVTGQALRDLGVQNFENVEVPGVRVSRGGMADTITVRGIGSGQNLGFEQSAPMYIDGVYFGRARTQRLGFLDIDQIEFLKGPQPTFLGKNAIAGAINITTRRPGRDLAGEAEASFEPVTDEWSLFGALTVPLNDSWSARSALRWRDSQGYLTNTITGRREPAVNDLLGRFSIAGDIGDSINVTAIGYFGNNKDRGRNNQATICEPNFRRDISDAVREPCLLDRFKASSGVIPDAATQARPDLYTDDDGGSFLNRLRAKGATLLVDWDVGSGITLSSVTGYYEYNNYSFIDTDQGIANFSTATFTERYNQFSQELRLRSPDEGPFKWFVGAYFDTNNNDVVSTSDNDARNLLPFTPPAVPPQTNRTPAFVAARIAGSVASQNEDAKSWALFAEGAYDITSQFRVRAGLRYEEVRKDIDDRSCLTPLPYQGCTPLQNLTAERKDTQLQPAVTLEYRPTEDALIYGSFKRGFKAGGFSGTDAGPFNPETVSAFELGLKSKWFDNRLLFNLTAFRATYSDLQVSSFDPVTNLFATTNAAAAKTQGVEAELQWVVVKGLRATANISYLDAKYADFTTAQCWAGQTVATGCLPSANNPAVTVQDLSGVTTPYAPTWSGTIALNYSTELNDNLTLRLGGDMYFTSEFATLTDINPRSFQGSFAKFNGRIALAGNDFWEVAVVGRNIFDRTTAAFRNTIPGGFFSVASFTEPPRTVSFQARLKF